MAAPGRRFVSRGGEKLAAALESLPVRVEGRRVLDAGAATGGFSDAALQSGAASVIAVDVAYGQLDWGLRNDPRVEVHERTNIRHLTLDEIGEPAEVIVADLAFIDLRKVRPAFEALSTSDAEALLLVKPQFELPRNSVPRGGVVKDPEAWRTALELVIEDYEAGGWTLLGVVPSPIVGPKGNREFVVALSRSADAIPAGRTTIDEALEAAP